MHPPGPALQSHDQESFDLDEEEPNLEPAWPHLQVGAAQAAWAAAPRPLQRRPAAPRGPCPVLGSMALSPAMPRRALHAGHFAADSLHPWRPACPRPPPQIVYEFLLRYVVSSDTDAKVAKKHIDQNFVVHLLDLFDSGGCWRRGV